MPNSEFDLTLGTFVRWMRGEPLSVSDMERYIKAIGTIPLQLSNPTDPQSQALLMQLREAVQRAYSQPQQPQPPQQ